MVQDVSFELHKGEVLGFSGLMGAGRTETMRALFGADPIDSGDIYVNGKKVTIKSPQDAVKNGIGYLSEDRKRFGIVVQKTVARIRPWLIWTNSPTARSSIRRRRKKLPRNS